MSRTVAFINFKGGVGKTTNVVNLAACLAQDHARKVLVVDLDPQCNATFWLLKPHEFEAIADPLPGNPALEKTTYQLFHDFLHKTYRFDFERAVWRGVPRQDGLPVLRDLHLLPAARALMLIDEQLCQTDYRFKYTYLFDRLKHESAAYDYTLLDCPPNVYPITRNALFLADDIVVPFNPDFLSSSGFRFLARILHDVQTTFITLGLNRPMQKISALTLNRSQKVGTVWEQARVSLLATMDVLRRDGLVSDRCVLLDPPIRTDVAVAESTNTHLPVVLHKANSLGSADFRELTRSFLRHFEGNPAASA